MSQFLFFFTRVPIHMTDSPCLMALTAICKLEYDSVYFLFPGQIYATVVLPMPGGPTISPTVPRAIPFFLPVPAFAAPRNASSSRWDEVFKRACPWRWRMACAADTPNMTVLGQTAHRTGLGGDGGGGSNGATRTGGIYGI
jgi:hypothetical protein